MRYGSVPVVRKTGGLADTVIDISEQNGYGIVFDNFNLEEFVHAIERGADIYNQKEFFEKNRKKDNEALDFSWKSSTEKYIELYKSLKSKKTISYEFIYYRCYFRRWAGNPSSSTHRAQK